MTSLTDQQDLSSRGAYQLRVWGACVVLSLILFLPRACVDDAEPEARVPQRGHVEHRRRPEDPAADPGEEVLPDAP